MKRPSCQSWVHRRRAIAIFEMLIVVILLTALASILTQLFVISFKAQRDSLKYDALQRHVDTAVNMLRHDVWSAGSISIDGPRRLELTFPAGGKVVWRYSTEGILTRTTREKTQSWTDLPPMAFSNSGPLLMLRLQSAPCHDESVTFISQQMAGGGGQ